MHLRFLLSAAVLAVLPLAAAADDLQVPARALPPPTADISPQMQAIIAAPAHPGNNKLFATAEEAHADAMKAAEGAATRVPQQLAQLHIAMTQAKMGGARVYILTPPDIPAANRNKILIHLHGGCYVRSPGMAALGEAITMAAIGHYKIISVDYRMPPEAYFPGALDDAAAVYREVLKTMPAKAIGVFGTSAGGALTLELMLRARQLGLPMPGAIAPGSPMADATRTGDSFYTNEGVDTVLGSRTGFCDNDTLLYAHGHDLKDPLLSPIYGDMHGFPPAILTTGTRDLLLSSTIRVHRKLRRSGVEADLNVYEGESHAQFGRGLDVPETRESFGEIAAFFRRHLHS